MTSTAQQYLSRNGDDVASPATPSTAAPHAQQAVSDPLPNEQIHACYFALNLGWRILEANGAALEFFHMRRSEITARTVWELFPPERYPSVRTVLEEARATNAFHYNEFQHYPDSDHFLIGVSSHPFGMSVFFDRITERKLTERQLILGGASSGRETPLIHDVVYRIDARSHRCESLVPSTMGIPGVSPEQCVGREFLGGIARIHPEDQTQFSRHYREELFGTTVQSPLFAEYRWRDDHGEYHWLSDSRWAHRADSGRILSFVGSLRDVTAWKLLANRRPSDDADLAAGIEERDEARRAFPATESRYQAIVENQSDLVYRFRPDGTISFVNEAYCRFFGLNRDQCVGISYSTLVHPDDYLIVQQALAGLSPNQPTVTTENRVFRYDGDSRWVQWTNQALYDTTGSLVEYQSSGRDVTDRRTAEKLLAAQYEVTLLLAESDRLEGALRKILESIAVHYDWDLVAMWTPAESGGPPTLAHACSPERSARSLTLPRTGVPERVFEEKKLEWLHPGRHGDGVLSTGGYRTLVAVPVRVGDDVMAAMECFSRGERPMHADVAESLGAIGHQIGNYWKRELAEDSLRKSAEQLEEKVRQRTQQLANALEALSNSEVLFRTMIESAPMGIVLLDEDGIVVEHNRSLERLLGYPEEGLLRVAFESLVVPDDRQKVRAMLVQSEPSESAGALTEIRMRRVDGGMVWGSVSAAPIVLGGSGRHFATVMINDITERKLVEVELRRSEEQFRTVFAEAPIGVALLDPDGRHVRTNQALHEMLGYQTGALDGMELEDVVFPDDLAGEHDNLRAMAEGRLHRYHRELRFVRRDRTVAWANVNSAAIRAEEGDLLFCLQLVEDITEQKRLQQMLVETERHRSEDLRRFATSVQRAQEEERQRIARELHDDICQRLSGMKLNMEVLEDEIRLTDRRTSRVLRGFRKQFEQTISEVRRLSSNLRPTVLDDFGLTIAMNLLVRDFEKTHGIHVYLDSRELSVGRLDPQVEIALYRIAQESLTNIARHAEATSVHLTLLTRGDRAELTIRDDGRGFESANSMNAREAGHGMGLISMRERAELLGGTCLVTSQLRTGTTVHASIPLPGAGTHEKGAHLDRG